MLSLPEIENVVMQQCAAEPRTAMLLYGILEYAREADHALRSRDERIRKLEALLVRPEFVETAAATTLELPAEVTTGPEFACELDRVLAEAARHGDTGLAALVRPENPLTVLELHGQKVLDAVFERIERTLREALRHTDPVARCGEGTFACLITRCEPEGAMLRLLDVLRALNAEPMQIGNEEVHVRVAFGTAAYGPDSLAEDLLAQAEEALLRRVSRRRTEEQRAYRPRVPVYEAA